MATINPKTGKTNAQVLAESSAVANQARALIGGSSKSLKKQIASRLNGKLGGRPKKR